jgi:hypothetical protein
MDSLIAEPLQQLVKMILPFRILLNKPLSAPSYFIFTNGFRHAVLGIAFSSHTSKAGGLLFESK